MTLPTITYGVGAQDDCGNRSDYSADGAHDDGMSSTMTIDNGTVVNISVSAAAGNKSCYYEIDIPNTDSNIYSKIGFRYRTSDNNIKAKIVLRFTGAASTPVLAETSNTDWTYGSANIPITGTIDKVWLYATSATGNVYYDFWSIFKGTQTFHNFDDLDVNPRVKKPVLGIPSSDTGTSQHLGRANTIITIEGPMRAAKNWASDYATTSENFGEFLKQVLYDRYFQWFTSDQGNFKVMPHPTANHFRQSKDQGYQLRYVLVLEEYDVGDASIFTGKAWYGK